MAVRYKTIMLDVKSHARLARAREAMRKRSGLKLSYNDVVSELASSKLELADIDEELKKFIMDFTEKLENLDFVRGIMLFGSVATGSYNQYSDIDIFIVAKARGRGISKGISECIKDMSPRASVLMEKGKPSLIAPIIIGTEELKIFRPIYLDIADYGIILYERAHVLADFIHMLKRIPHRREYINKTAVLTWA